MLCEQLGKSVILHAAIRDLLVFYDRVAGTGGRGGKSGESWSTAEVLRLNEIRALVHTGTPQAAQDARKPR